MGHEKIDGPVHVLTYMAKIQIHVEIRGENLTPQQFEELKFVAQNCSLGNTLRRGVELEDQVEWVR